jgi:hypothetical protein
VTASAYRQAAQAALRRHFQDVRLEWSIVKDAADLLSRDRRVYAPRVDIAVGPFSITHGRDSRINKALLPEQLRRLVRHVRPNPNPRCLLAIEVVYSGTSKHIMGDMLNASALGLYALVVGRDDRMPKILRIGEYVTRLAQLDKSPELFANLVSLSTADFDSLLA